jgi:hypothetical protein
MLETRENCRGYEVQGANIRFALISYTIHDNTVAPTLSDVKSSGS